MDDEKRLKEVLLTVNYRLKYCANIYGSNWRREESLLKACKEALEYVLGADERELNDREKLDISNVYQDPYCMRLVEIAKDDETAKSIFLKLGLLTQEDLEDESNENRAD